ncbi:hypothetical protein EDB85DRAFT_1996193 [Lactarius pseudohatsudake]|nr:hypothetical protein EDB85DRAFT_1996193 [Lactarius pseudohatsudake]
MAGLKLVAKRVLGWVYLNLLGIVSHGLGEDRIEDASASGLSGGHCRWFRVSDVLARLVMEVMGSLRWRKHSERVVALYKHWQWCSAVDLVPTDTFRSETAPREVKRLFGHHTEQAG